MQVQGLVGLVVPDGAARCRRTGIRFFVVTWSWCRAVQTCDVEAFGSFSLPRGAHHASRPRRAFASPGTLAFGVRALASLYGISDI